MTETEEYELQFCPLLGSVCWHTTSNPLLAALLAPPRALGPTSSMASRTSSTSLRDRSSCTKSRCPHPLPHLRRKRPSVVGLPPQQGSYLPYREGLKVRLQQRGEQHPPPLLQLVARIKPQVQKSVKLGYRQPKTVVIVQHWDNKHPPPLRRLYHQVFMAVLTHLLPWVIDLPGGTQRAGGWMRQKNNLLFAFQSITMRRWR